MRMKQQNLTRRDFLKVAAAGLGGLGINPWSSLFVIPDFPDFDRLGRAFTKVEIKSRPDIDSPTVDTIYDDTVVPCLREVVGNHPFRYKQRWYETPQGYIWASELQPVHNLTNPAILTLP